MKHGQTDRQDGTSFQPMLLHRSSIHLRGDDIVAVAGWRLHVQQLEGQWAHWASGQVRIRVMTMGGGFLPCKLAFNHAQVRDMNGGNDHLRLHFHPCSLQYKAIDGCVTSLFPLVGLSKYT